MLWRERINKAQERGTFNAADRTTWWSCKACICGEAFGGTSDWTDGDHFAEANNLSRDANNALNSNDFSGMLNVLEKAEALAIAHGYTPLSLDIGEPDEVITTDEPSLPTPKFEPITQPKPQTVPLPDEREAVPTQVGRRSGRGQRSR